MQLYKIKTEGDRDNPFNDSIIWNLKKYVGREDAFTCRIKKPSSSLLEFIKTHPTYPGLIDGTMEIAIETRDFTPFVERRLKFSDILK